MLSLTSLSLVFIDATVSDYEVLAQGVTSKSSVLLINSSEDGITQISRAIAQHPDTDAIHILSHGSPGSLYLGNSQLNLDTLSQYSNQLQSWQVKEILLYGCNVAAGDAGAEFVSKLQGITKASIAATQTLTGNAELGGNWDLEVQLGEINSQSVVTEEAKKAYTGVMATYRVNTLQDEDDGIDVGNVSLRDAINAANQNPGADTIVFEPFLSNGVIALNVHLSNIYDDLDIIGDGTIKVSGRNTYLPFYIDYGEVVTFDGIQIINGFYGYGRDAGGIYVDGNLTLINSIVTNNFADDDGGGIYVNYGSLEIINTHIFNNSADDGGGGIFISRWASPSKIINSTINNNTASFGGGIRNTGNLEIINSTISRNTATTNDGGLGNGGLVSIVNTTITENTAPADETAGVTLFGDGSLVQVGNTIIAGNNGGVDITIQNNGTLISRGGNVVGNGNGVVAFTQPKDQTEVSDPQLGPLVNNGGPTPTHEPLASSPAVNAGLNSILPVDSFDLDGDNNTGERLPVDQRGTGFLRVIGDVDAGAVEFPSNITTVFLTASPTRVDEDGNTNITYTFQRTGDTNSALNNVKFNVSGNATFNQDYTQNGATSFNNSSGTISFNPNQTTKTITINPTSDITVEPDENIVLSLVNGNGYTVTSPSSASAIIEDDDKPTVSVSVSPESVTEDGSQNLVYTFRRTGILSQPLNGVKISVGGTATFNNDYTQGGASTFNNSNATINFSPNQATKTITINPKADTTFENDETVRLSIAGDPDYVIVDPSNATGTILNDEPTISVSISNNQVDEDGNQSLVYRFERTGNTSKGLQNVRFNVSGNASFGSDYTQSGAKSFNNSTGSLNFSANQAVKTITINPKTDTVVEGNETVKLTLANGNGYKVVSPNNATGTIVNDDANVSVTVSPASVTEDGSQNLVFTFRRVGDTSSPLQNVKFNVGGNATFNSDYVVSGAKSFNNNTGLLNFGSNQATKQITINPKADNQVEGNETVRLSLVNSSGYNVINPTNATGTIRNDDVNGNSDVLALIHPGVDSIL